MYFRYLGTYTETLRTRSIHAVSAGCIWGPFLVLARLNCNAVPGALLGSVMPRPEACLQGRMPTQPGVTKLLTFPPPPSPHLQLTPLPPPRRPPPLHHYRLTITCFSLRLRRSNIIATDIPMLHGVPVATDGQLPTPSVVEGWTARQLYGFMETQKPWRATRFGRHSGKPWPKARYF